jgi:hypothetical protein
VTAHEVLVKARNPIADPSWWCKGSYGGYKNEPKCAVGAMEAIVGERATGSVESAFLKANNIDREQFSCVEVWNDARGRTHAEVLAAFDKAIQATAPSPDLSFLKDVRVEPERVA